MDRGYQTCSALVSRRVSRLEQRGCCLGKVACPPRAGKWFMTPCSADGGGFPRRSVSGESSIRSSMDLPGREVGKHLVGDGSDAFVPLSGRQSDRNLPGCCAAPDQFIRSGIDNI